MSGNRKSRASSVKNLSGQQIPNYFDFFEFTHIANASLACHAGVMWCVGSAVWTSPGGRTFEFYVHLIGFCFEN